MLHKDCFRLGHVVKPYSFKGEIIISIDTDNPKDFHKLESVLVEINKKLVPFFIQSRQVHNQAQYLRVRFEGINTEQQAQELNRSALYLPNTMLPKARKNQLLPSDLIGFTIIENNKNLGEISNYYDYANNPVLEFIHEGKEVMMPFNEAFILKIDPKLRIIEVSLPEGLLDVYTSANEEEE
ncbi:MAG: ribosome maturation factor RimM [Bacteroidia bacterium]